MVALSIDAFAVADDLLRFGEDATATWIDTCSDDELVRVGNAAMFVADYGPNSPTGGGMMLAKACAIGAVYVHEGVPRKLARGRRDARRVLPKRPSWATRQTSFGLQRHFDEFYGVGDDLVEFWAASPEAARERIDRERESWRSRPRNPLPSEPTHVRETDNGRHRFELNDWMRPFAEQWSFLLEKMDGADNGIFSVWPLPPGKRLGLFNPADYETGFMQSAGSAQRMTVELRRLDDDGQWRQYAVGKPGSRFHGAPTESIAYGAHSVNVFASEIFTAEEAASIYENYRVTGGAPAEYSLRLLNV